MKKTLITLAFSLITIPCFALSPEDVIVIYNSDSEESKQLADYYAQKRSIPAKQIIGFKMPIKSFISREEFTKIHDDIKYSLLGIRDSKKLAIVLTKGVPHRVMPTPKDSVSSNAPAPKQSLLNYDNASFDSEIAANINKFQIKGMVKNDYYNSDLTIEKFIQLYPGKKAPTLVTRLDGPSLEICKERIDDTLEAEESGLWGMTYIDKAKKDTNQSVGDLGLNEIQKLNWSLGLPTISHEDRSLYPNGYPMANAAIYYGWYAPEVTGPFNDPNFKFKKGAIATHIHSFSGTTLTDEKQRWVAPLVNKGACAVLGNAFEPFLQFTTHLPVFHARLLSGYTFAEAAYMATPALSWQNVMVGDPLYTPFKHLKDNEGKVLKEDKSYRAFHLLWKLAPTEGVSKTVQLRTAAAKSENSEIYEFIGLLNQYQKEYVQAQRFFSSAIYFSKDDTQKARIYLQKAYSFIDSKNLDLAEKILLKGKADLPTSPYLSAFDKELEQFAPKAEK
ncbi:TIGR03790 family protein [Akkermansiaceae bacterium]|nr:TIGR03790 family protein [Akkermansiaceae bacterium]